MFLLKHLSFYGLILNFNTSLIPIPWFVVTLYYIIKKYRNFYSSVERNEILK